MYVTLEVNFPGKSTFPGGQINFAYTKYTWLGNVTEIVFGHILHFLCSLLITAQALHLCILCLNPLLAAYKLAVSSIHSLHACLL